MTPDAPDNVLAEWSADLDRQLAQQRFRDLVRRCCGVTDAEAIAICDRYAALDDEAGAITVGTLQ